MSLCQRIGGRLVLILTLVATSCSYPAGDGTTVALRWTRGGRHGSERATPALGLAQWRIVPPSQLGVDPSGLRRAALTAAVAAGEGRPGVAVGFVAADGIDTSAPAVWTDAGGSWAGGALDWHGGPARLTQVARAGRSFVAIGQRRTEQAVEAFALTSGDGVVWRTSDLVGADGDARSAVDALWRGADGCVVAVVGWWAPQGRRLRLRRTCDGGVWTDGAPVTGLDGMDGATVVVAAAEGTKVALVGTSVEGGAAPGFVLRSDDSGATWRRLTAPDLQGPSATTVTAAAFLGDAVVLVGSQRGPHGDGPRAWIGRGEVVGPLLRPPGMGDRGRLDGVAVLEPGRLTVHGYDDDARAGRFDVVGPDGAITRTALQADLTSAAVGLVAGALPLLIRVQVGATSLWQRDDGVTWRRVLGAGALPGPLQRTTEPQAVVVGAGPLLFIGHHRRNALRADDVGGPEVVGAGGVAGTARPAPTGDGRFASSLLMDGARLDDGTLAAASVEVVATGIAVAVFTSLDGQRWHEAHREGDVLAGRSGDVNGPTLVPVSGGALAAFTVKPKEGSVLVDVMERKEGAWSSAGTLPVAAGTTDVRIGGGCGDEAAAYVVGTVSDAAGHPRPVVWRRPAGEGWMATDIDAGGDHAASGVGCTLAAGGALVGARVRADAVLLACLPRGGCAAPEVVSGGPGAQTVLRVSAALDGTVLALIDDAGAGGGSVVLRRTGGGWRPASQVLPDAAGYALNPSAGTFAVSLPVADLPSIAVLDGPG